MERLTGVIQPYAWGSPSFIPELLGEKSTGEPQAELWLGAHPSAPALLGGQPLDALVAGDADTLVGARAVAEFGPVLPFLLKILAAARPLSLQAHPSRAQAEAGFAAEEEAGVALDAPTRTYRDQWPKPEVLCALGEAEILCGFREPSETAALFELLGVPAVTDLVAPLRHGGAAELEQVFRAILDLGEGASDLVALVADAAARVRTEGELAHGELARFARTALELAGPYPGDPGVLAALLMNRMTLHRYDAVFLDAGNLHAYLQGSGVEIMANSDNVLRGGLTSKHVDVPELLRVLDFATGAVGLVPCVEKPAGTWSYLTPAPEFALWRLEVTGAPLRVPRVGAGRVLLVVAGSVTARANGQRLELARGQSAFLVAADDVELEGEGTVFVAGPGIG